MLKRSRVVAAACALFVTFTVAVSAHAQLAKEDIDALVRDECAKFGASAANREDCAGEVDLALLDHEVHATIGRRLTAQKINCDVVLWQTLVGVQVTGIFDVSTRTATVEWQLRNLKRADGSVDRAASDGVVRKRSWDAMLDAVGEQRMELIGALRAADPDVAQAAVRQLSARMREKVAFRSRVGRRRVESLEQAQAAGHEPAYAAGQEAAVLHREVMASAPEDVQTWISKWLEGGAVGRIPASVLAWLAAAAAVLGYAIVRGVLKRSWTSSTTTTSGMAGRHISHG